MNDYISMKNYDCCLGGRYIFKSNLRNLFNQFSYITHLFCLFCKVRYDLYL